MEQAPDMAPGSKAQGIVRTAGSDPNDPALHGLSEEDSGHSLSRGVSPKAPSFTRPTSFSSNHGTASVGSPPARSGLEQNDSFTWPVASAKDRANHEGVELGMMRGSSHNIGEELLGEQLHSFAPEPGTTHGRTAATRGTQPQPQPSSTPGAGPSAGTQAQSDSRAAASGSAQAQPVSFQSLAALASSHANQTSHSPQGTDLGSAGEARLGGLGGGAWQARAQSPFKAAAESEPDNAAQHQERLPAVSTGRPVASEKPAITSALPSGTTCAGPSTTSDGPGITSARPGVLGRPTSEKKWAYPIPTGSPMFERVRSRNHDQESPSGLSAQTERSQPVLTPSDAAATDEQIQIPRAALGDRLVSLYKLPQLTFYCQR